VTPSFIIQFVSEDGNYDYMCAFKEWLQDKLESELFVDNFRTHKIDLFWHNVLELEPDGEEDAEV
jgi:hypothetical protein